MVDTVKILLTDYDPKHAKLQIQPARYDSLTGAARDEHDLWEGPKGVVRGQYAMGNDGDFNVNIHPTPEWLPGMEPTQCSCNWEVPKLVNGHNFHPCTKEQIQKSFKEAEYRLRVRGIKTNIETAKFTRLDAFKNIETSEPYENYVPVLQLFKPSRMDDKEEPDGFRFSNGQHQICVYDKIEQMRKKKMEIKGLPSNVVRFEHRLIKSDKIRKGLDFDSVKDLMANLDQLKQHYERNLGKLLFKYDASDVQVMVTSEIEHDMRWFKARYNRNWFQRYMMTVGLHSLLKMVEPDVLIDVVQRVSEDRSKASRLRSEIGNLQFQIKSLSIGASSNRTVGSLYNELKNKVCPSQRELEF